VLGRNLLVRRWTICTGMGGGVEMKTGLKKAHCSGEEGKSFQGVRGLTEGNLGGLKKKKKGEKNSRTRTGRR